MIITFFGHSNFLESSKYEKTVLDILLEKNREGRMVFYFGGYGNFDEFCYRCCRKFKKREPASRLVFVTPYITEAYQKSRLAKNEIMYDEIIYPGLEQVPYRYAIVARNKWMSDNSDLIVSYIDHSWGGAYNACKYSISRNKEVINIGKYVFK